MINAVEMLNQIYDGRITIEMKDQYYNMREKLNL